MKKTNNLEEPATNTPEVDISEGSGKRRRVGGGDRRVVGGRVVAEQRRQKRGGTTERITDMVDDKARAAVEVAQHLTEEDYQDYLDDLMKRKDTFKKNTLRSAA